ncbi:MAG: hypothetical protein AAGD00_04365, partial [Planctomycetota bacterium]
MPHQRNIVATTLLIGSGVLALAAAYVWLGFDRSTYYTDHGTLQRDSADADLREVLWREPESLGETFDSELSEADPAIAPGGSRIYFSRVTDRGDTDLFVADRVGDGWGPARALDALNTLDNESDPEPASDGTLYFASDRPGGLGGFDLWALAPEPGAVPRPLGERFNSAGDERGPALGNVLDIETLIFASTREREDFDLYRAPIGGDSEPTPLLGPIVESNELAPAISPAGDFVYFASDREGGAGGFDLYRVRVLENGLGEPARLDDSINTAGDELEPELDLEGFAIVFATQASGRADTDLRRAVSREVVLRHSAMSRGLLAQLLGLLPWLLAAIALVMLLAALRRWVQGGALERGVAALGLMARCIVLSILIHALLMALLSVLTVKPIEGEGAPARSGTQV